jgi:pyruvate dehydrogenase E2 component (dihydrolipoamide acetyltransferase)
MSTPENGHTVVMPKLGLTMTGGTIVAWHKGEGQAINKGELLFTLETDKAALDIEAPAGGNLHILVPVGEHVPVLQPIAVIRDANKEPARPAPAPVVKATPVARKMAAEAGLELAAISGTGPRGEITRQDVEGALASDLRPATEAQPTGEIQPLTGLRRFIAERLSAGWHERPQVTLTAEADATNLVSARQQIIAELGEKLSYDDFFVMLVARALHEHPRLNARLTEAGIERLAHVNVGVAVDTERGLLVPVVLDAASLSLMQIHHRLQELTERALAGGSLPDDLSGGTFTITNLGMYDIDAFTPIINPPECAILGVGRIAGRPVGFHGQVVLRDMLTLSLSFDHRLIDGGPAARFLQRVKQLVERPVIWISEIRSS